MSELQQITISDWFETLRGEGLLGAQRETDPQALDVHANAFFHSWLAANDIDARALNKLRDMLITVNALLDAFDAQDGKLFYGADILERLIDHLYGQSLFRFIKDRVRQRRLLIEGSDECQLRMFTKLIVDVFGESPYGPVYFNHWSAAVEAGRLSGESIQQYTGQAAYQREKFERVCVLTNANELTANSQNQMIQDYPMVCRSGLGPMEIVVSVLESDATPSLSPRFRQFIGLHGSMKIPSLSTRLEMGVLLQDLITSDASKQLQTNISETALHLLVGQLEGSSFLRDRDTLLALLCLMDARQALENTTVEMINALIQEFLPGESQTSDITSSEVHLRHYLAARVLDQMPLPNMMHEVERAAYHHAARVALLRKPNHSLRMQDLADILGVPRQTASRKWHHFDIKVPEITSI